MNEDGGGVPGGLTRGEVPPLVASKPPGLLPIPPREPHLSVSMNQQDKQVQAAMAMAAFYSQSPLWQQMVAARERLHHASVPHPAAQAAMAALTQLPGRAPPMPCLPGLAGLPPFPGLAGLQSSLTSPSGSGLGGAASVLEQLGGAASVLEQSRAASVLEQSKQEMYRDYLSKLAQSTLHVTTSGGGGLPSPPSPQYLQTLQTSKADNMPENSLPRNVRLSTSPSNLTQENITSRNIRSPPSPLNYIGRDSLPPNLVGAQTNPFFVGLQPNQVQQQPTKPVIYRSPTNGGPRKPSNGTGREKVFTCNVCNRSFGYKHVLQNHERTHTGEKPFECKECHKRFTRDHHLKTHMRLHTGEKPYSCSHCDRQFVQVANLRRHLRVHTGERPYKCELCPSTFSDSNQLKAHNLIHNGEKPFNCDKCGGKFRRRHHLMHHVCPMDEKKVNLNTNQFLNLKEELLLRYTGAGFPHPGINIPATMKPPIDDGRSSNASLSPDSKDTGSGGSPTPGEPDSTGEKRRSRKQKPRRVIQWTEEGGGDESPRNRHVSSTSFHQSPVVPEQTEPEDLTIFRNNHQDMRDRLSRDHDLVQAYQKERTISQYSMAAYAVKEEEHREDEYSDNDRTERVAHNFAHFNQVDKVKREDEHNRSEEEGSTSVSDPHSAHSTPGAEKFRSEDMDEDEDEKRGVSPPMSNTPFFNPLFSHPAAIQLGLASTTMPLASLAGHAQVGRYTGEKETEWEKNHVHKEISQQ